MEKLSHVLTRVLARAARVAPAHEWSTGDVISADLLNDLESRAASAKDAADNAAARVATTEETLGTIYNTPDAPLMSGADGVALSPDTVGTTQIRDASVTASKLDPNALAGLKVPVATSAVAGIVKPGRTMTVAADGTISPTAATREQMGICHGDGRTIDTNAGVLSVIPSAPALTQVEGDAPTTYVSAVSVVDNVLQVTNSPAPGKGEKGDTGPQGPQGEKGATGAQGPQGEKGEKGEKGDTGPQGPQGVPGATGATGPQGPQGEKGATGATGAQGPQGPQGEKGDAAEITWDAVKPLLLNNLFPVGYVWISYTNKSPASIIGGTWTPITGRFPYFNAGIATGGSNTTTLTVANLPPHTHMYDKLWTASPGNNQLASGGAGYSLTFNENSVTTSTGTGTAFNNMPAYQTLYAWRRTA